MTDERYTFVEDVREKKRTAWRCSSCDLTIGMKKVEKDWHHYGPNCGAHMMEEDNGL